MPWLLSSLLSFNSAWQILAVAQEWASWAQILPCPDQVLLATREVPQAHSTHLASLLKTLTRNRKLSWRALQASLADHVATGWHHERNRSPPLYAAFSKWAKPRFSKDPQAPRNQNSSIYFRRIRYHGFFIRACCRPSNLAPIRCSRQLLELCLTSALWSLTWHQSPVPTGRPRLQDGRTHVGCSYHWGFLFWWSKERGDRGFEGWRDGNSPGSTATRRPGGARGRGDQASEAVDPAPLRQSARRPLASRLPRRSPPPTSQPFVRLVAENGRTPSSLHLTSEGATSEPASLKGAMLPIGCLAIPPAPSPPSCACAALGLPGQRRAEVFCSPRGRCELALAVLRPQTSGSC